MDFSPKRYQCRIRQGCRLAPLLFIIALDILFRAMDINPNIEGIVRTTQNSQTVTRRRFSRRHGCVWCSLLHIHAELSAFGDASGLRIDPKKSICVPLGAREREALIRQELFTLLADNDMYRYLGVLVGECPDQDINWELCIKALFVMLALATIKTHTVMQRAEIARTFAVPKILYLTRFILALFGYRTQAPRFCQSVCVGNSLWTKTTSLDVGAIGRATTETGGHQHAQHQDGTTHALCFGCGTVGLQRH